MSASVEVVDRVGLGAVKGPVGALVSAVLAMEGGTGAVVVAFVTEEAMAGLNIRYRGLKGATDVLSFPEAGAASEWPAGPELGEVVVCPAVVARYAAEDGLDSRGQLGWTLIHGLLHLLGYDHEVDEGEMRRREQELLERLAPLVAGLPAVPAREEAGDGR